MKNWSLVRIFAVLGSLGSFLGGGCATLSYLASLAPNESVVKVLGGLIPGKWVLFFLVAIVLVKVIRVFQNSIALTMQTGAKKHQLVWSFARSFLEGGMITALTVGALNPAMRPAPILLLDLPSWEKNNWQSESEKILDTCAVIVKQHRTSGLQVKRANDGNLIVDSEFDSLLRAIANDESNSVSTEHCRKWNRLVSLAWQDAGKERDADRDERRVYEALQIIHQDLTGVTDRPIDIPDQQVFYVVSLGRATPKRVKADDRKPSYWPLPTARGVSSTWRCVDPEASSSDQPLVMGKFHTQSPYFYPRIVLTYLWPKEEGNLPTTKLERFKLKSDVTSNSQDLADGIAEIPPSESETILKDGLPYLQHSTVRAGAFVSLTLEGPALNERFGDLNAFEKMRLTIPTGGKPFVEVFELDKKRRLAIVDDADVSKHFARSANDLTVIAKDAESGMKSRADVIWTTNENHPEVGKPLVVISTSPSPASIRSPCSTSSASSASSRSAASAC